MTPAKGWKAGATTAALYAGGLLGPFGGAVTSSVLPEIGADFDRTAGDAAVTLTLYLLPFAALMLFSGTLGARWGAVRTVRTAYLVYVLASLLCAVAWTFPVLLAGRVLQGAANAFTTPLLLTALAALTPKERLGRTLGVFASMQAVGQTSAPLVGGLAAEASWRWAFLGAAVLAALLAWVGMPETAAPDTGRLRLRSAWRPSVVRIAVTGFIVWGCLGGLSFLVAFRLGDGFGLGAGQRGLVLTGFGIAGILTARLVGRAVDRFGARRCVLLGSVVGAVLLAGVALLPSLWAVGLLWAAAGACSQGIIVGVNALVLSDQGANRGGSVSVVQSLRFLGGALSPALIVPLYHLDAVLAFLVPAALLVVVPPLVLRRRHARTDMRPGPEPDRTVRS
ncbi:MFS transporter [Umezawaea sp. Da 62-37]|uniref:MFS transporter n=1 Tax=Umezawaea sp. Da 62-37 TaxID=3075927 RepID=UPI0028F6F274|nr:MFS transporter [Umezawaea sp. Da 62-37]WNV88688.1 MFS transporter [Umezawaea sp. Da 62-37]